MPTHFRQALLALCILSVMQASFANETEHLQELESIDIKVTSEDTAPAHVEKKTAEKIQQEMIRDTRDLVRYSPDVGLADNGRHLKGFAMRGVDGNRVGISIDGISVPDFEENSLYKRYGNFNNSRLSVDSEFVRTIESVKGSDSFDSGSGALGGIVKYKTLNAEDLVTNGNFGGLARVGYASKNNEWVKTVGFGYTGEKFDAILMYSQRDGHEMESAGGNITPQPKLSYDSPEKVIERSIIGPSRIEPDPSTHKNKSYLAKVNWKINPHHSLGLGVSGQDNERTTNEYSYESPLAVSLSRQNEDVQKLLNTNLFYQWNIDNDYISSAKIDLDYQKTENGTINNKGRYKPTAPSSFIYTTEYDKLENIDFRNSKTEHKQISLTLQGQPINFGGSHNLSSKIFASKRDFKNINHDVDIMNNKSYLYTIQRPTSTKSIGFSLQDDIRWNDTLSSMIGIRYDQTQVSPKAFEENIPCSYGCYRAELENPSQKVKFSNTSWKLGLEKKFNDNWLVGYNIGTGFRVPTASELYFQFSSGAGAWKANPNLKSEKSLNHNLYIRGDGRLGSLDLSTYYSQYKDFLYEQETIGKFYDELCQPPYVGYLCETTVSRPSQQMVNIDKAKIYGAELKTRLDLAQITPLPEGLSTSLALGYSQGKLSIDDDLFSIQPFKMVYGLDYEAPSGKWGLFSRATYHAGKKADDAMYTEKGIRFERTCAEEYPGWGCVRYNPRKEIETSQHQAWRWLNKSYTTIDLFGYYRPTDHITLRAGVFNLTDKKYHTWDTLRGINIRGTTDKVDHNHNNQGLERFYAPGRNYSASIEFKF